MLKIFVNNFRTVRRTGKVILVDFIQIYFFGILKISTLILMLLIIQALLKIQESSCQETQFAPPINLSCKKEERKKL